MSQRLQCVEILETVLNKKVFYSALKDRINPENLAFCNKLVLLTLRNLCAVEKIIKQFVTKKTPQKNMFVKYVLLASVTEILFLKTPDYAVINEYVNIAKQKTDKFAAKMVNAVLRKICADKQSCDINPSLPPDFYKILKNDYSVSAIKKIAKTLTIEAPLDLSIKENHLFWAQELNGTLFANGTIRLFDVKSKINLLKGFTQGAWWVQDLASSLPILLLGDVKGKKVLDLCAAPGGKTAQLLTKGAKVTAVDIDFMRMERLKQNIDRLGLSENLKTTVCDGNEFLQNNKNEFDIIVLDAPCSATGTFRKHPEVVHLKTSEDVKKQIKIQTQMLKDAVNAVKIGGLILYCTCSISKSEGEKIIQSVLEDTNIELVKAKIDDINLFAGKKLPKDIIDNGVLRTLPYYEENLGGMDAFFAAILKKIN
ncbi:MAG: RsmB/NOP family class I SAM-dependent RNA methyltransferase [Alphaproteobacteria bacterium]|nr:RsmB/NOP family class I SAM-dependent RNA methyltransferase [Alphaproteobacteria bacterium]